MYLFQVFRVPLSSVPKASGSSWFTSSPVSASGNLSMLGRTLGYSWDSRRRADTGVLKLDSYFPVSVTPQKRSEVPKSCGHTSAGHVPRGWVLSPPAVLQVWSAALCSPFEGWSVGSSPPPWCCFCCRSSAVAASLRVQAPVTFGLTQQSSPAAGGECAALTLNGVSAGWLGWQMRRLAWKSLFSRSFVVTAGRICLDSLWFTGRADLNLLVLRQSHSRWLHSFECEK